MKKEFFMTLAAACMVAGLSANQAQAPVAVVAEKQQEKSAVSLNTDELAFAAKLNDQNRKAFSQFTATQRTAAMKSVSGGCAASSCAAGMKENEAVQKVMKESQVVVAEKAAQPAAPAK